MRRILSLSLFLTLAFAMPAPAAEPIPEETSRQLRLLDAAIDVLNRVDFDVRPDERASGGESFNQAFVALTGEAVNPLFGITVLGIYNYIRTPDELRDSLPIYDQPEVWVPLLVIIFLMLFNSTLCEAIPFLKVPLNALGDIVNKAGAVAVLPLVVKMFADSVAPAAGAALTAALDAVFPAALAAEAAAGSAALHWAGWLAGLVMGFFVYAAVWLAFNVVDVLILICPFPGVDALLKSFRLAIMGALMSVHQFSPTLATLLAAAVVLASLLVAGWSFRLSVFGLVFSTDIILFRRGSIANGRAPAFVSGGLKAPVRTLGRLERDAGGALVFSYRPWLVGGRRRIELGKPENYAAGKGLISVFLVDKAAAGRMLLRFPPRYRGMDAALADSFGLAGVVDCGVGGSLRSWLAGIFGLTAKAGG